MSYTALIYALMLVFDALVIAGAAYLIGWKDWSAWWMLLAVIMCAGSNPRRLIEATAQAGAAKRGITNSEATNGN